MSWIQRSGNIRPKSQKHSSALSLLHRSLQVLPSTKPSNNLPPPSSPSLSHKARRPGSFPSAIRPTNSEIPLLCTHEVPCPCRPPAITHCRAGGIGDVLAACGCRYCCEAACLLCSHVSHLPLLGITQPLLSPLHPHPSRPPEKSKTATPPPSVFLTLWPWPAARVLPPHYPLFKHSAVPQA